MTTTITKLFIFFALLLMSATFSLSLPIKSDGLNSSQLDKRAPPSGAQLLSSSSAFTYYWVAAENEFKSKATVTLRDCKNRIVGTVNRDFADEMRTEGTGLTKTGAVFNFDDCSCKNSFNCFEKIDSKKNPFGIGPDGKPLEPFISVAANDFRQGTKLYIPKLDGLIMPGGTRHNGCVRVDDQGFGFGGKHIDFFVGVKKNYDELDRKNPFTKVKVFDGQNCTILKYNVPK